MKQSILKFVARCAVFTLVVFICIAAYFTVFMSNIPLGKRIGSGAFRIAEKAANPNKQTKKIVIGDSVASQKYPFKKYNDSINSISFTHAVTLVGYYCVLDDFLKHFEGNKEDLEVYVVYRPSSFRNNLDQRYTFNYFLKPFYKEEYFEDFTPSVFEAIEKIPFYWLSSYDLIKTSNWAPIFRTFHNRHEFKMAPISAEYLLKMEALCKEYGLKGFHVMPTFMSDEFEEESFDEFKAQLNQYELNHLFEDYFEQIVWLDNSLFTDGAHLKRSKIEEALVTIDLLAGKY